MTNRRLPFLMLTVCTIASLFLLTALQAAPPDGDSTEIVIQVQTRLQEEGFKPGPIDGIMGPRTRAALRAYQSEHGLATSGRIDEPTLQKLGIEGGEGFFEKVGSGFAAAGAAVGKAAKTGAKATAKGVAVGAEAAADATAAGAKATAKGVAVGAEAAADATAAGAKATAKGSVEASEAVADAAVAGSVAVAGAAQSAAEKTADAFDDDTPSEELADRVRERLKRHPGIAADKIRVTAEGPSTVRLTFGENTTSRERNLAVVAAKRVSGVERVFIRLTQSG